MVSTRVSNLAFVFWAVMAMALMPYSGVFEADSHEEMEDITPSMKTIKASTGFNASDGFTPSNITVTSSNGAPLRDNTICWP